MPTGYTYNVEDGTLTDFNAFAMQCARAFGACIMMRDESNDAKIPERFHPDEYHKKAVIEAKEKLREFKKLGKKARQQQLDEEFESGNKSRAKSLAEITLQNQRYDAMLAKVKAWKPPSKDHEGMKEFMIKQLEDSKHDTSYYTTTTKKQSLDKWTKEKIERYEDDVEYHEKEWKAEIKRALDRTEWVALLRESLP